MFQLAFSKELKLDKEGIFVMSSNARSCHFIQQMHSGFFFNNDPNVSTSPQASKSIDEN
jgi:hypothetical protein